MSNPITLEDIFQLFERQKEETERRAAEAQAEAERRAAEAQAEADRRAAEWNRKLAESKAEWDRQFAASKAEADRQFAASKAEADRRTAEWDRKLAESKAEWDRQFAASKAEADRRHGELEKLVAAANAAVNNLTSRWGRFVEELVRPAVIKLFEEKGIHLEHTFLRAEDIGRTMEIDILGVNSTDVVLVECKSRFSQDDLDEFLEKLPRFKTAFREFSAYKIYGAIAGIEIDQGVDRRAYKKGLFVIKPSGDTVAIVNDGNFRPKNW